MSERCASASPHRDHLGRREDNEALATSHVYGFLAHGSTSSSIANTAFEKESCNGPSVEANGLDGECPKAGVPETSQSRRRKVGGTVVVRRFLRSRRAFTAFRQVG